MEELLLGKIKVKPVTLCDIEKYKDYIYSDILIVPSSFLDNIYNNSNNSVNTLKISSEDNYVYGTVYDFTQDDIMYVSVQIFQELKKMCKNIFLKKFTVSLYNKYSDINIIELKPHNVEFFNIKDQIKLFENYIGTKYRVLYNGLLLRIYSKEINKEIQFTVILENEILIEANNMDLNIDFKPDEELVKEFEDIEKDKKEKLENLLALNGTIISTKTVEEKELTREEIRELRMKYFQKKNSN